MYLNLKVYRHASVYTKYMMTSPNYMCPVSIPFFFQLVSFTYSSLPGLLAVDLDCGLVHSTFRNDCSNLLWNHHNDAVWIAPNCLPPNDIYVIDRRSNRMFYKKKVKESGSITNFVLSIFSSQ